MIDIGGGDNWGNNSCEHDIGLLSVTILSEMMVKIIDINGDRQQPTVIENIDINDITSLW